MIKNPPVNAGDIRNAGLIPGQKDPKEEGMSMHSSMLAWRIWQAIDHRVTMNGT